MSDSGLFVLKDDLKDTSIRDARPKDFAIHSKYDTLKEYRRGTISLYIPELNWWCEGNNPGGSYNYDVNEWSDVFETKIPHGLGYTPMYSPPIFARGGTIGFWGQGEDPDFDRDDVPTSVIDVFGNYLFRQCSVFGWGAFFDYLIALFCDDTYLYLREMWIIPDSYICIPGFETDPGIVDAHTTSYPYVIFYNEATERLSLDIARNEAGNYAVSG